MVVFIFGVFEHGKNDALRFLTSTDLKNWTVNSTNHPDPRWYHTSGRWDHMYMSQDSVTGGFIGFPVSSPSESQTYASTWPGIQRSVDGIHWSVQAPLNVSWEGVNPTGIEEGGFERVKGRDGSHKYYLIGGGGGPGPVRMAYSMWVFASDKVDGPYQPLVEGFRLSGGTSQSSGLFGWLAAWCGPSCDGTSDGTGSPLISNYITPGPNARADVWMLPMRKPIVDAKGVLRLAYWDGNDALQAENFPLNFSRPKTITCDTGSQNISWLTGFNATQHAGGVVLSINVSTFASGNRAHMGGSVGIAMGDLTANDLNAIKGATAEATTSFTALLISVAEEGNGGNTANLVRGTYTGGTYTVPNTTTTHVLDRAGLFQCGKNTTCRTATVTNLDPSSSNVFRVLFRQGMWEVYLNDLLVQSYVYGGGYPLPSKGIGHVGVMCMGDVGAQINQAQAWQMGLSQ